MQEKTVTYQELARQAQKTEKHQIVLAIADGKIRELFQTAKEGEEISFLTTADRIGHDTWVRSAVMLLMKAASDVAGSLQKGKLKVEFSIGRGLYCSPQDGRKVDSTFIDQVRERMRELAAQKVPFVKMTKTTDDAIALFESQGMADKVQLFRYRRASCINVYELDGYYDYNYGYMVPDTGYIDCFDLFPYQDGLMLLLPERRDPEQLPVFEERKKLFKALEDSTRWGEKLGITTVGDLNDKICGGDLAELILVQEAMQENWTECRGYRRTQGCQIRHDCGTFFFRENDIFSSTFHSAKDVWTDAASDRGGQLFCQQRKNAAGRGRQLQL